MIFSLLVFGVFAGLAILMLRSLHRGWWEKRWVRRAAYTVVAVGLVGVVLRSLGLGAVSPGPAERAPMATIVGAALFGPASVALLMMFLSLPLAALARQVLRFFAWLIGLGRRGARRGAAASATRDPDEAAPADGRPSAAEAPAVDAEAPGIASREVGQGTTSAVADAPAKRSSGPFVLRRALLEGAVAAIPVAALGAGAAGVVGAYGRTRIVPRPMRFASLPSALSGLRILQLTDLHLGAFLDPGGVARIVEDARRASPDLVVLTGDFSDHLPWLRAALEEVKKLSPRLGIYAVLGNHEHYRGPRENARIYGEAEVDLLLDAHRVLSVGDAELNLVGVDDPGRYSTEGHYERAIDEALGGARSTAFTLGLCHRPSGFPALASRGVDLTLSGHTHGAQVGLGERSLLEKVAPEGRLWGRYAIGDKQLYTSSGAGHWFAFRLNCPSEAALVTLERA